MDPIYHGASAAEVAQATSLAAAAFPIYSRLSGATRAKFLRSIANEIEALGEPLTTRAMAETGLPEGRIKAETGRTTGQLRLHASVLEEGSWCDARIDHADPARQPIPKVDLRSMQRAVGPVAVFCASNFPLAFSVAGGDTCAALAAGCPVIVKAHSSHPGTAELVGGAIRAAVVACGLPDGVFSLLYGSGRVVGTALVQDPAIKAVGFTGSRAGGRALMDLAAARPEPIPVYAEMSSINPVVMLAGALTERAPQLAAGLHGSVTVGVGQMCTNPGLIILEATAAVETFQKELGKLMTSTAPGTMLNAGICAAYRAGVAQLKANPNVQLIAMVTDDGEAPTGSANVFVTSATAFLNDPSLGEEVFGPTTLLVLAQGREQILELIQHLEGQLTATLHGTDEEITNSAELLSALEAKAGRVLINGFPTGVEVCHAIVHGGPYPATSDGRSTSVGVQAVARFTRPVAYQNFPDAVLPAELQDANPLRLSRIVDGVRSADFSG